MLFHDQEDSRLATMAEADREYADNVGRENPDQAWILSDRDVWYSNPFYRGEPQPHPESYDWPDIEAEKLLEDAEELDRAYAEANANDEGSMYADFERLIVVLNKLFKTVPRTAIPEKLYSDLYEATANAEAWLELGVDDPRANGWVNDRGLP